MRGCSRTPLLRNSENTAAASVEPTIAAINKPNRQSMPSSSVANSPSRPTLANTPQLASTAAGLSAMRNVENCVRRPPSSRITARAS